MLSSSTTVSPTWTAPRQLRTFGSALRVGVDRLPERVGGGGGAATARHAGSVLVRKDAGVDASRRGRPGGGGRSA